MSDETMGDDKVRVEAHGVTLVLEFPDWRWVVEDDGGDPEVAESLAADANLTTRLADSYSPADGQPGCRLAGEVAESIGGKAILPPVRQDKEEVVY